MKLTEEILLAKAKKSQDVSQIVSLDLSRMNLRDADIVNSFELLSKLKSIEVMDLSGNKLTKLPPGGILQNLRKLDCSRNNIKSLISSREFQNLEFLNVENNALNLQDTYIAVYSIPNLKKIGSESTSKYHLKMKPIINKLQDNVHLLWEEDFYFKFQDSSSDRERKEFEDKFIRTVTAKFQDHGPKSLEQFRKYVLTDLAKKLINTRPGNQFEEPKRKKRKLAENKDCPSDSTKQQSKQQLVEVKGFKGYHPVYCLRTHSSDNSPHDSQTKIWKCLFEPDPLKPGSTTNVVVTCGGNSICWTDCGTGKVVKKYKAQDQQEVFFTAAWTTVLVEKKGGQSYPTNLMAAGGSLGHIRLFHCSQLVCYHCLIAHPKSNGINTLNFHPEQPTHLFSGSDDRIYLWDIGVPSVPDYKCNPRKLLTLLTPSAALSLVVVASQELAVAGCETGLFVWKIGRSSVKKERAHSMQLLLPGQTQTSNVLVDSLVQLEEGILACKYYQEDRDEDFQCDGLIHLWDFGKMFADSKLQKGGILKVQDTFCLEWCKDMSTVYLYMHSLAGLLVLGNEQGQLHVYDLPSKKSQSSKESPSPIKAKQVLDWPLQDESAVEAAKMAVVNDVATTSNKEYIVGVTDHNLVCIWKLNC